VATEGGGQDCYDVTVETEVGALLQYMGGGVDESDSASSASLASSHASSAPSRSGAVDSTAGDGSASTHSHSDTLVSSVAEVMAKNLKKRRKNRKLAARSDDEAYVPLDFMDWTAKVI
jgi:hypothetical protein